MSFLVPAGAKARAFSLAICGTTEQLGEKLFVSAAVFPCRGFWPPDGRVIGLMLVSSGRFYDQ